MAAEVPVCDVLCEAMEYLSKLGSNLRTRSESLMEKKINKNRLKNAHAVHKAANKVLLICELSKKSLENVETGVRKVLSIVDASQAPSDIGGKTNDKKTHESKQNFYHFEFESHKLRISKKIPLKHYMSVKVFARGMPESMLEKYPVFYDCKLKRKRELGKQKGEEKLKKRRKSSAFISDTDEDNVEDSSVSKDNKQIGNKCVDHNKTDSIKSQDVTEDSNLTTVTHRTPNVLDSDNTQCEQVVHEESSINIDNSDTKSDSEKNELISVNKTKTDKSEVNENSCEKDIKNLKDNITNGEKCNKSRENKGSSAKKKLWRVKFVDNGSESDEASPRDNFDGTSQNVNNSSSGENENSEQEFPGYEPQIKNNNLPENHYSVSEKDSELNTTVSKDTISNKEVEDESRPLIRCVNITKLLKPDILDTKISEIPKVKQSKDNPLINRSSEDNTKYKEHKKRIYEYFASKRNKEKNPRKKQNDEAFWEKKRMEVKKFKPKQFSVNIERLPQFSVKFLVTHNLQKIVQSSKTILEIATEKNKDLEHSEKHIDNVKNALLNDSDSDNGENSVILKAKKVKESLLNDSISDQVQNSRSSSKHHNQFSQKEVSSPPDPAAIKTALLNDSDTEKNSDKVDKDKRASFDSGSDNSQNKLEQEVAEKIKSALLNDSDSDKSQSKDKSEEMPSTQVNMMDNNVSDPNNSGKEDNELSQNNKENNLHNSQSKSNEQDESTQDSEKIKSSLLNDSSDIHSESSGTQERKKKIKTPKHKRKHAMRSTQAKKMLLRYSSSSENEDDSDNKFKRHKNIRGRKKSFVSSSSSEERSKKQKSRDSSSEKSIQEKDSRDIDQVDGTIDEHSDNSVRKMVRSKAKPSGSSSQNSSNNQDPTDKDIDGLTDLNSLNKTRRRDSASTNNTRSSKKKSITKTKPVLGEDLLHTVSSSDASEDDDIAEEDLPPIQMTTLNGSNVDHLAKDDLLGDSDSSMSHKDQSETQNIEDSEAEENLKAKRRKANAISSDSEGGTSRAKQQDEDVRLSDFEDSEDEISESNKRSKRKKKISESDGSGGSSNEGTKKRKRIKQLNDSDGSGSDTENEGRNKHGRKNIRKVMGKNQLEEATKKAAREEKERIARIAERQKLYNNLEFDESGKPDEVVLEKVVLDFDPETKEPLIEVDRGLVKKLKPHQANGIKFMWDACFESAKRIKKDRGSGCILAHCMGLGKTLQVISLTHTLLTHNSLTGVNRVLVVCPLSTVLNWVNEIRMWLKHADSKFDVDVYELSRYKQNSERAFQLQQWFEGGGVCVLGYEMFRNLSADNPKKYKKKMLRSFQESLVDPGPDLVVCDEGHLLKNEKTSLSQSMNRVRTQRRIVLTGTPLQNNLKEYYCMVQFVKPNLLGKYNEYLNRFVNPITNGQYTDSTEHDIKIMKRRSHVLHKMLDGAVQRRDYGVLAPFLPPKHEYVLFITLTDVQVKLYQFYLDNYSRRPLPGKSSGFLFPDFQSLQRIWTHPLVLKYNSERYEIMQQKKREREEEDSEGSLVDFIDDDSTPDETSTEESSDDSSELSDDSRKKSKKKNKGKKGKGKESKGGARRGTRANPVDAEDEPDIAEVVEVKNENPTEWWIKLVEDEELDDMRNSSKLVLLFDILRQCETIGDKLLVFSQSLYSLDLIEHFLGKVDEATQEGRIDEKLGGHVGSWSPGVDYFRLDGSTSCENRSIWCKNFNREDNPRARLFLISTRAGGLGINLVAANRVVIFDVSWNPSHDVQSIFRVYRFGQKKPCYVYRFLAMGTMEEKIYERQVTKQAISKRVIDEQQIDRHYAENDLAELYKFEARPDEPRPLPTLPKDRLFAEMLREHEAQIYKYHEHDSLLENKEEETLSEEERKAAWEDFENEKNKPPPAPFPSAWPMHNGMVPGLLAQQQQQLAYAAIAAMLRKDVPNINDNQIRDVLPAIYNSNPGMFGGYDYGLMQKMSEIYKYAQPGMMNPGMMNAVMSSGTGGAAAGMGGTSGLQYEPPWQRQHQQQQQMRLQQLMQQNQMGAKFYAGGLGSRDPVAMALQQQRAREIMMGGGAGRPRGRPPHQPRAAAPDQDQVVNLDSD